MEYPELEQRILRLIADLQGIDVKTLQPIDLFSDQLKIDSMGLIELVMEVEDEFDIDIDDDAVSRLQTISDLVKLVEAQFKQNGRVSYTI